MNGEAEKVYVAIGNDLQDGFKTLAWTLKKWRSQPISIVILHVAYSNSKEYVYTPFGKLPASSVSEKKVEVLRRYEQEKIDRLFSKYIDFCGQVKAEILKVEKSDEPVQKLIVDLISELEITNLVISFMFMKPTSWKSKTAISGSFYIYRNKPHFCELFVIGGGRQVFLRGENHERIMEDDKGAMIAKIGTKHSLKGWLGKMFTENTTFDSETDLSSASPRGSNSSSSRNSWDVNVQELEKYYEELLLMNLQEEDSEQDQNSVLENSSSSQLNILDPLDYDMNVEERMEHMRSKIEEAREIIQSKKNEAKENAERQAKAEWAINLCNQQAAELEAKIKNECTIREKFKKEIDSAKANIQEIAGDIKESKIKRSSLLELQTELSSKHQISTEGKSRAEAQLEKAMITRDEMVREMEELRRQIDILTRRIDFCKDKDAIAMAQKLTEVCGGPREYTAEEITLATDHFSNQMRLSSGVDGMTVFRGRMSHGSVAIQLMDPENRLSLDDFRSKVELLSHFRHPHLIAMMGFCSDPKCIVFDYMHSGSLREILFPPDKSSRKVSRALMWHDRIRVASEVCSGLVFLHQAQPRPISHGNLGPSKILLDRNMVARVSGIGLAELGEACDIEMDIRAFGALLLHLVTGRDWAGLEKELTMGKAGLVQSVDDKAGQWPLDLVDVLVDLALRCANPNGSNSVSLGTIMEEIDDIKEKAEDLVGNRRRAAAIKGAVAAKEDADDLPRIFICPILQEMMKNPHLAADGFSYELEAIEQWIIAGHDTSPMTNLRLQHPYLTPNHTLRSLIQDWQNKASDF